MPLVQGGDAFEAKILANDAGADEDIGERVYDEDLLGFSFAHFGAFVSSSCHLRWTAGLKGVRMSKAGGLGGGSFTGVGVLVMLCFHTGEFLCQDLGV